jgi:hypothetical protein
MRFPEALDLKSEKARGNRDTTVFISHDNITFSEFIILMIISQHFQVPHLNIQLFPLSAPKNRSDVGGDCRRKLTTLPRLFKQHGMTRELTNRAGEIFCCKGTAEARDSEIQAIFQNGIFSLEIRSLCSRKVHTASFLLASYDSIPEIVQLSPRYEEGTNFSPILQR